MNDRTNASGFDRVMRIAYQWLRGLSTRAAVSRTPKLHLHMKSLHTSRRPLKPPRRRRPPACPAICPTGHLSMLPLRNGVCLLAKELHWARMGHTTGWRRASGLRWDRGVAGARSSVRGERKCDDQCNGDPAASEPAERAAMFMRQLVQCVEREGPSAVLSMRARPAAHRRAVQAHASQWGGAAVVSDRGPISRRAFPPCAGILTPAEAKTPVTPEMMAQPKAAITGEQ